MEIGTWNGDRAIDIAQAALNHHAYVHYWGFDLFEHAADDHDERELNVKPHIPLEDVHAKVIMELQVHASRRRAGALDQVKRKAEGVGEIGIELRDGETAQFHDLAMIRRKNDVGHRPTTKRPSIWRASRLC